MVDCLDLDLVGACAEKEPSDGSGLVVGSVSGKHFLLKASFCLFSWILRASERILFFLSRSLLSASVCTNFVFTIRISCFSKDISVSFILLDASDTVFFLAGLLLDGPGFWKEGASGFSCEALGDKVVCVGMIVIIEDNDCEGVVTVEVDELGCDRVVMGLTIGDCTNVEVVVVIHTELLGNLKVHAGILVVSGTEVPLGCPTEICGESRGRFWDSEE